MRRPNRCVEFAKPSRPCVSCLRTCVKSFVSHVSIRVMTRVSVCIVHQDQRFASDTTSRNTGQAPQEIIFFLAQSHQLHLLTVLFFPPVNEALCGRMFKTGRRRARRNLGALIISRISFSNWKTPWKWKRIRIKWKLIWMGCPPNAAYAWVPIQEHKEPTCS